MTLTYRQSLSRSESQFDTDLDLAMFGIGWMLGGTLRDCGFFGEQLSIQIRQAFVPKCMASLVSYISGLYH